MKNKPLILIVLFFSLCINVSSQSFKTDSLQAIINSGAKATEKLNAYRTLTNQLLLKNFDDCISTASEGMQLAQQQNDRLAIADFLKITGTAYYFKGNYDSAARHYYEALAELKGSNDAMPRAAVLNELGKLYRKTRDLDRALQNYDEALAIYKKLNAENEMATILNESGVVFEYKHDYKEAIRRYQLSLDIKTKLNDTVGMAYSLNFLGGVYTIEKKFKEAEQYLQESLQLRQSLQDSFTIALSYSDLGAMYFQQGNYYKAMEQYLLSNEIASTMKFADLLMGNYKELAGIAEKTGNMSLSLDYLKKHFSIKDSIYSEKKMKQIEELNARYQSEKKEHQLELQKASLSKKNFQLWGISIGMALLLLSVFTFYRKRQAQQKLLLQNAVMQEQEMATRAVIAAEENERKRIAADLHDGVGQMMSVTKMNLSAIENDLSFTDESKKKAFEKIIQLVDESCKEIRSVSHQMMPNALLKSGLANAIKEFIDKLDSRIIKVHLYTEGLNERLEGNVETILYRVIQECVNNVIKHSGAETLDISLIKDVNGIVATIEDNGQGFDSAAKADFQGIGLKNIISRVSFLKGTVDFDSAPGRGTLVAIFVPLD